MKKLLFISALISLILFPIKNELYSIPAFARQFKLSCQTCHNPAPRLKPYGEEFAANGFKFKDKEAPRYFQETGDDKLSLLRELPFAIRFDLNSSYNTSNKEQVDFATPYVLKLLSGGNIADNVSYYFYFFFSERGEVAGIEDAYIMFNDLFGIDLDLYVGQFQVSDPLFKRELRLSFEDYELYRTKVGLSPANLTYDRGVMLTLGLETGTDFAFQILNGNGIGPADEFRLFDFEKNKNYFFRVSQDIFDIVRVGGFAHLGKESISNTNLSTTTDFTMFGPDVSIYYKDIAQLNFQYITRTDKNTLLNSESISITPEVKTQGAMAELVLTPRGDESGPYGVLLFNYVESDLQSLNKKSYTAHIGHAIRRNLRLYTEYSYYDTQAFGKYNKGLIGLMVAF